MSFVGGEFYGSDTSYVRILAKEKQGCQLLVFKDEGPRHRGLKLHDDSYAVALNWKSRDGFEAYSQRSECQLCQ
jgi:hypothetical protein